jgi:membrane fusion protein (multidrug efflux system)
MRRSARLKSPRLRTQTEPIGLLPGRNLSHNSGMAGPEEQTNSRAASAPAEDPQHAKQRQRARPWVRGVIIAAVIVLILGALIYWLTTRNRVTTDDAYVDGRAVSIAPRVAGAVISLDVNDNQFVHAGDPLIHLDPRPFQLAVAAAQAELDTARAQLAAQRHGQLVSQRNVPAQLAQAQAQLRSARAALEKAQNDEQREHQLSGTATTAQEADATRVALSQAQAQVAAAEAQVREQSPVPARLSQVQAQVNQQEGAQRDAEAKLAQAELDLTWTIVQAPQDGWITKRSVELGDYVSVGQELLALVSPQIWITANFKENQLVQVRPGQPVRIAIDMYPDLRLRGHVDSIQLGSGSKFSTFPPENATGNFIKIVQRIPVKIDIDSGLDPKLPLPLGSSAEPTIYLP